LLFGREDGEPDGRNGADDRNRADICGLVDEFKMLAACLIGSKLVTLFLQRYWRHLY
jgi:hypothetical protein